MDIQTREFQAPKIVINYETIKAELESQLERYAGLVVTEDSLAGSKAAQKELASLRVKIDTYRKEKKSELEQPIKTFEAQCKELISLVERVEQPLKDGIKFYDDQKREEKRQQTLTLITEVAEAQGLNEKYAARLTVLDKYTNLTATAKGVKEDLETRAFALKVEQDREAERLEIINSVLASENSRLKVKLELSLWQREIDADEPTSVILDKIKAYAAKVYEAENKPAEPEQQPVEAMPEPTPAEPAKRYTATFKIVGTLEELKAVSALLKKNNTSYKVYDQREV